MQVKGVSPDAVVVTNEKGGQQSKSEYAFHLIDDEAILAIAERLQYGQDRGYERDNWRKIPAEEHWNHMLIHWFAWKHLDKSDDHLKGFICRAMMAFACARQEEREKPMSQKALAITQDVDYDPNRYNG